MKIALLSIYSGHVERGLEVWADELLVRLSKSNDCILIHAGNKLEKEYQTSMVPMKLNWSKKVVKYGLARFLFFDYWSIKVALFTILSIPKLIKFKPDIIIPTNGGWQSAIIKIFSFFIRCKIVIVGQSGIGWDDINNLFSFPDVFVALSKRAKKWAKRINPFTKIVVIPNAIDLSRFKPEGSKINFNLPKPIVLIVSALEKNKQVDLTIKAVSKTKRASLLVIGDGPDYEKINEFGQKLLGNRFKLIKHVNHNDIASYYRSSDVFTLASWRNEAFGIVYLEAMACGLPIVATNDELRSEIIGGAGILVNPDNIGDYAMAIEYANQEIFSDRAKKQVAKYSWDNIAYEYENLFKRLLK